MTPSDWGLVISPPITKEVEEVLTGGRSGFGPQDPSVVAGAVALVTAISAIQVVHGLGGPIPSYTEGRDADDDKVIHTAILSRAGWVLSQDRRHVSLGRKKPTVYRDESSGRETGAVGLWYFINRLLCAGLHFDNDMLAGIDGSLLNLAVRPPPEPSR